MRQSPMPLYLLMLFIAVASLGGAAIALWHPHDNSPGWTLCLFALLILAIGAPVAAALYKPSYRAAALVFCAILITIWFGILLLALGVDLPWLNSSKMEETMLILLVSGLTITPALVCRSKPWGKIFSWSFVSITTITTGMAIVAVWFHPESAADPLWRKVLGVAGWTYLSAGIGSILLVNVGRDKRHFRWLGILAAMTSLVAGSMAIWKGDEAPHYWWYTGEVSGLFAATLALVNLLLMTKQPGLVRRMQVAAIILSCVAGAVAITLLTILFYYDEEDIKQTLIWFNGALAASFILANGAILCFIAARAALRIVDRPALYSATQVHLNCPNCGLSHLAGLNSTCPQCLLKFRIVMTEPHCGKCQHLLLNLTSDRCPECGAPVRRPPIGTPPADIAPATF